MASDNVRLLERALSFYKQQPKIIEIDDVDRLIFVGDTHGDLSATQHILDCWLKPNTAIVFLGDYVDRGPKSEENVLALLEQKLKHPEQIYLLQGNHENWVHQQFRPATFWEPLDSDLINLYSNVLTRLPYCITTPNGIIAVHAALPAVDTIDQVNEIGTKDDGWWHVLWGDYQPRSGQFLGDLGARPQFGEDRFNTLMDRFEKNVLIRGHQPPAPKLMYNDRCITIICSSAHSDRAREIVFADMNREIKSAADLEIAQI